MFITSLLFLLATSISGQNVRVQKINIIPDNPTETDSIRITTEVITTSNVHFASGMVYHHANDTFYLSQCFVLGTATVIDYKYDTVNMGLLNIGNHYLVYQANAGYPVPDYCDTIIESDTGSMSFSIFHTGINDDVNSKTRVYPNPVTDVLNIETENPQTAYYILDCLGNKMPISVKTKQANDVSLLSPGMYFLAIENRNTKEIVYRKILKE